MKEDRYILLVQKQLAGEITPGEQTLLDDWLADSPDHRQLAASLRKAWSLSEGFSQELNIDLEADYQKIEQKLGEEQPAAKIHPLFQRRWVLRAAAVILLLIVGHYAWENYGTPTVIYADVATGNLPAEAPVELLDGSQVWLNANSKLTYFASAVNHERRVKLEGEAFFVVAKDENIPFVVESASGEVTVLGTSFNVSERSVGRVEVAVATGKVALSPKGSESTVILLPNEKGIYLTDSSELIRETSDHLNELAWHTKKLVFDNTKLAEAVSSLSSFFRQTVDIQNEQLLDCPVTASFDNKPIETVLETLATLTGATIKELPTGGYVLTGGACQ